MVEETRGEVEAEEVQVETGEVVVMEEKEVAKEEGSVGLVPEEVEKGMQFQLHYHHAVPRCPHPSVRSLEVLHRD